MAFQEAQAAAAQGFDLQRLISDPGPLVRATLLVFAGMPAVWALSRWIRAHVSTKYNPQRGLIAGKVVFWPLALIIAVSVLKELGFSLAPLLGAAGILGVAIGFASQTSVSNVISGFFLLGEEPFKVGDTIQVGDVEGVVLTIDMLSVKIRTFDNRMVRIPNESLVKSQFTNVTYFPIRRVDITLGVARKEDIGRVRRILLDVAASNPNVLMEPEPLVMFQGFGASSVDFKFAVWARQDSFLSVKNGIAEEVKRRFDAEGVELPFPHVSLHTAADTEPFPVRLLEEDDA
ncbi:MAG: mechanosensitive ion channel family protein [Gemmatimonadetes bacterium]|nr:mechanosensitive ion channel family protein [Gemmatimonadota bacterium]